ncbi:RNA polymerase sigma factor [Sandaracinus amylolyticus]|uniref:RNA polymerase sigma-70 factor, ECF subfamily n=1 Tax=Sandaracinus amylolyticus TaxID=927083 RepID=A0A0F6YLX7_9BACT|nr:RNA polymerase sigma factor [Sandaracinus amylolyticus]AKF08785.1 RNA polymerase sigma-70 factor, ECF subfamily [Sandaracinus amylolyticus]
MDPTASDEELMRAYVAGDARAFEVLFTRYAARVHALFSRTFRSRAIADDLVQTTFLKIHAARATYRSDLPVRPWLFGIAARVRIDELRRRYRTQEVGDDALDSMPLPVEGAADAWPEANEAAERVRRAIDTLPDGQRIVVLLHRFEGMSFGEIAIALREVEGKSISEVAVRVRAFRAYDALRTALADLDDRERPEER